MASTVRGARRSRSSLFRVIVVLAAMVATPVIGVWYSTAPLATPAAATAGDPVVAAAGDIACRPGRSSTTTTCQYSKTATLINGWAPAAVLPLGDTQYDTGATAEYAQSYNPTWGVFKSVSRPAVGNHEYMTTGAGGYYGYFGANAGSPSKGYYSYNITGPTFTWHVIALNTECSQIGGCGVGSPEEVWLKADLAANKNVCTIAYSHRPRFSSGSTIGSASAQTPFFQDLYNAGADLFLSGHAHHYERFAPMTASGALDNAKGVTQFIVGTGGDDFQGLQSPHVANSIVAQNNNFGALKLTLHASSYDFQFAPAAGYTFTDSGSGACHNAPAGDTTKPTAPTNLRATAASANQVNLSWGAATDNVGVKNYQIYRGSNGGAATLLTTTTTNATTFSDTAVTGGTAYTYQVYAQDAAGLVGPGSNIASVTTPSSSDTTPPSAPVLNAENIASDEIDIGWTASSDSGTGTSGYRVYRKGPGESVFTLVTTQLGATNTTYADKTVKPSSTYAYYVTAFDGANNESAHSNTVTDSTPAGPATKTFTFTASGDATIQQASSGTNVGSATPLIVDNSPVDDVMMKFNVATTGCESLTSAKLTLTNSNDGSVRGGDFYTTGPNWAESTVTWANAPTRGALLNSLGAVATNATATVDVTQGVSTLNGEADFRIGTTTSDGVHYFSREGTGGKPTLTVVCATSAPAPDTQPPTVPGNLRVTGNTAGEVGLAWDASTDNTGVTNYDIYRGGSQVGTVPGTSVSYQDTTVSPNTSYSYTVTARDAANNASAASTPVSVTTPAGTAAPAAPTGLTATAASSTSVNLSWAASTSPEVSGYNIYRGSVGGNLQLISSSGAGLSFTDAAATPGTAYDYAVTAVATGGTESALSNRATVTTPGGGGGGGAITAGTARTTLTTTAATSWTVNLPTFAAGDLMVIWLGNNLGSTGGTPAAAGWTAQVMTNESSGLKGTFLTRRMVTGDSSTLTVTYSLATLGVAEAVAFTGVNATTPVEAKGGLAEASTTAVNVHSTPGVTTTTANDVLVTGFTTDNASTWTSTGTEVADALSGSVSASLYYSAPVTATGSQSRTATASIASVKAVSSLLALRP